MSGSCALENDEVFYLFSVYEVQKHRGINDAEVERMDFLARQTDSMVLRCGGGLRRPLYFPLSYKSRQKDERGCKAGDHHHVPLPILFIANPDNLDFRCWSPSYQSSWNISATLFIVDASICDQIDGVTIKISRE